MDDRIVYRDRAVSRLSDIEYHPSVADLTLTLSGLVAGRLLLLGGDPEVGLPAVEARHAVPPDALLSNGLYVFRTAAGVDVLWCQRGHPPGPAAAVDRSEAAADHPLCKAQQWFEFFWAQATPLGPAPAFDEGDWVTIAGDGSVGRIEGSTSRDQTHMYRVRVDGNLRSLTEAGLRPLALEDDDPLTWLQGPPASAQDLAVSLTVTKLTNPLTDVIYSYLSSKTVFRPYQFRPVLRLLDSPHQRLLIADEVGLGKTIEAGLIWTELEARNPNLSRVLIVCPAALVRKWQAEMRNRFDRSVRELDKSGLADFVDILRSGDESKPFFGVVSLERLRSSTLLADLTELHPRLDLVIVDEAHYLRNQGTLSYELGELLSDWADALLFLSATPLNLGNADLFNLLNLLAPDEFADHQIFPLQLEPNRHLNQVARQLLDLRDDPRQLLPTLDRVRDCQLGQSVVAQPEFGHLRDLLDADALGAAEIARARRHLVELNTLSSVLTRTRKVDVAEEKAVREPISIDVPWTDAEHRCYQAVLAWARQRALDLDHPVGFATQMPLRQAASCLPVMQGVLTEKDPSLRAHWFEDDGFDDYDTFLGGADEDDEPMEGSAIAAALAGVGDVDTKLDCFLQVLEETDRWGGGQILVFSFFRRTIAYLEAHLQGRCRVRSMHGGTKMDDRQRIMDDFRAGAFDILLASEVASEGLDFEFCSVIVNYDLPWNPMKVEQRIGRLDRIGQVHEKIFVVNFHVPGTIETDIFERLYQRIGVFEESIGELEPILRDRVNELTTIALDPTLSAAQREQRLGQVAVVIENQKNDVEDLREAQSLLAGIDQLLIEGFEQDTNQRGRFVGPHELAVLLGRFLADGTRAHLRDIGRGRIEMLGDGELADRVARFGGSGTGSRYRLAELVARLRDGEPVHLTYESELDTRSTLDLITFRHPLIRAATRWFADRPSGVKRFGAVRVRSGEPGRWLVVVHLARTTGLRPSLELWPVAIDLSTGKPDEGAADRFLAAVARGDLLDDPEPPQSGSLAQHVESAEEHLHRRQIETQHERQADNEGLVDARIAAQRASVQVKVARARHTLALEKVRRSKPLTRLHEGRINNLKLRLEETVAELDGRRGLAVETHPVAVAVMTCDEG